MKILLFVGAGGSVELGVPAMRQMIEELYAHLREHQVAPAVVAKMGERIDSDDYDMEALIEDLDILDRSSQVRKRWADTKGDDALAADVGTVRFEAEWFVMHVCERVQAAMAARMWGPTLRSLQGHDVTIATTNYDRAIEIAGLRSSVNFADGFEDFCTGGLASWRGFDESEAFKLLKVHGSTDWYHSEGKRAVWKLRHAMPLFGRMKLEVEEPRGIRLTTAVVLPSREKRIVDRPYQEIIYQFRKGAENAEVAIFLGSSLRDPEILGICSDCGSRVPTFVVTRSKTLDELALPSEVKVVRETASRFLISTLPACLKGSLVDDLELRAHPEYRGDEPILNWISVAEDSTLSPDERRNAIDQLAKARVTLDGKYVEGLLRSNEMVVVTYALGLVARSPDREWLLQTAQAAAAAAPNTALQMEVEILTEQMGASGSPGQLKDKHPSAASGSN